MPTLKNALSEHLPRLRRYARTLIADPDLADDLVQDCVARALEKSHRWAPGSDLRAWLFTIMHNLYVNQVRRWSSSPAQIPLEEAPPLCTESPNNDAEERAQRLKRLMYQLPLAQREVLALVVLEGLTYQQVAEILEVPIGTVMSRLSRARDRLKSLMSEPAPRLRRVK